MNQALQLKLLQSGIFNHGPSTKFSQLLFEGFLLSSFKD